MAATIRTAVTMQKTLFDQADTLAQQMQISRSQLMAAALESFIRQALVNESSPLDASAPRQGDIYWVRAGAPGGSAPDFAHPHVVIQEDFLNRSRIHSVVVCALTSNLKRGKLPGNVLLEAGEANLPRQSVVEVSKVAAVEKTQLGEYVGSLTSQRVDQILAGMRFLQSMT
jgi:mRNA interferase MazF